MSKMYLYLAVELILCVSFIVCLFDVKMTGKKIQSIAVPDRDMLRMREEYRSKYSITAFILSIIILIVLYGFYDFWLFTYIINALIIFVLGKRIKTYCESLYTSAEISNLENVTLYLRSFCSEKSQESLDFEKTMCRYLEKLGPTFAIGNPHEILPVMGANRVYATNEEWQGVIANLVEKARVIVIRVAKTEGTMWELEKCVVGGHILKTIFIIEDNEGCEALKKVLKSSGVEINLPEFQIEKPLVFFLDKGMSEWLYDEVNQYTWWRVFDLFLEERETLRRIHDEKNMSDFKILSILSKTHIPAEYNKGRIQYILNPLYYADANNWGVLCLLPFFSPFIVIGIREMLNVPIVYYNGWEKALVALIYLTVTYFCVYFIVKVPTISYLKKTYCSKQIFEKDLNFMNEWMGGIYIVTLLINVVNIVYLFIKD